MGMPMIFSMAGIRKLLYLSNRAKDFRPTYGQLFDKSLWKPGVKLSAEDFPTSDDLDTTKIKPGLILVGDQGCYLMSNAAHQNPVPGTKSLPVVYAQGADPNVDADSYEAKIAMYGGDDGTDYLPGSYFDAAIKANAKEFIIEIEGNSLKLSYQ